jgi:GR25 family glycosyltransferase involved in LPS biosynthesis
MLHHLQARVITLERCQDRVDHVRSVLVPQLTQLLSPESVHIFSAIDGQQENANEEYLGRYGITMHKSTMWRGQVACFLSHFTLWKKLTVEKDPLVTYWIMEDDTELVESELDRHKMSQVCDQLTTQDPSWKWMYMWLSPVSMKTISTSPPLDEPLDEPKTLVIPAPVTYGTTSYLLSQAGARYLVDHFSRHGLTNAVDNAVMEMVKQGVSGFFSLPFDQTWVTTVGPVDRVHTGEKLKSTITAETNHVQPSTRKAEKMSVPLVLSGDRLAFYMGVTARTSDIGRPIQVCLKSVRKHYPTSPVYVFEYGSGAVLKPLCDKFVNVYHVARPDPIFDFSKRWVSFLQGWKSCRQMIHDFHMVTSHWASIDWVMKLEPDVLVRGPVEINLGPIPGGGPRPGIYGCKFSFNTLSHRMTKLLSNQPVVKQNHLYSFAGGSLISTALIQHLMKQPEDAMVQLYFLAGDNARFDDVYISFLAYHFGFTVVDSDHVTEEKHHQSLDQTYRRLCAPVVHGCKAFY